MTSKKHLIIGSNSFLAKALIELLVFNNESVLGVYNKSTNNLSPKTNHIPISELSCLEDNFKTVYVISAFIPRESSLNVEKQLRDVNVKLVDTVCKQFKSAKIVYCSSVSVYKYIDEALHEESAVHPESLYGKSKLEGEHIVKTYPNYAIVRISSIYGKGMHLSTFLPKIIKSALESNQITIFGNGKRLQNYIHVNDVANYLMSAGNCSENNVFLATSKQSYSNIEIAECIQTILTSVQIVFKGEDHSKSFVYDNSRTNTILQTQPERPIKVELKNLIEWMKREF